MRWLVLVFVVVCLFSPYAVGAQLPAPSSADVTITASGFVVAAPGDFTVWYITDYEVGIGWTIPMGAANVMVRKVVGRMPSSRTDGIEVYYGSGTTAVDYNVNLDSHTAPVYYRAWSETATGLWEDVGASDFIEGVGMTLLILGLLALGLTIAMFATRQSMLGFPSGIFWAVLGGYAYQQSLATWDWRYLLFFASMGMVIFAIFAAYGLRNSDLAGPDADKGAYIDEGDGYPRRGRSGRSERPARLEGALATASPASTHGWGDIDHLGMDDLVDTSAPPPRSDEQRRARAARRRANYWGEFK